MCLNMNSTNSVKQINKEDETYYIQIKFLNNYKLLSA